MNLSLLPLFNNLRRISSDILGRVVTHPLTTVCVSGDATKPAVLRISPFLEIFNTGLHRFLHNLRRDFNDLLSGRTPEEINNAF